VEGGISKLLNIVRKSRLSVMHILRLNGKFYRKTYYVPTQHNKADVTSSRLKLPVQNFSDPVQGKFLKFGDEQRWGRKNGHLTDKSSYVYLRNGER